MLHGSATDCVLFTMPQTSLLVGKGWAYACLANLALASFELRGLRRDAEDPGVGCGAGRVKCGVPPVVVDDMGRKDQVWKDQN